MTLFEKIISIYPELMVEDFVPPNGSILLMNESDGKGDYIKKWDHPTLEKPTDAQLNSVE